jgi:hypothetical protein
MLPATKGNNMDLEEASKAVATLRADLLSGSTDKQVSELETAGLAPLAEVTALLALAVLDQAERLFMLAAYHQANELAARREYY